MDRNVLITDGADGERNFIVKRAMDRNNFITDGVDDEKKFIVKRMMDRNNFMSLGRSCNTLQSLPTLLS